MIVVILKFCRNFLRWVYYLIYWRIYWGFFYYREGKRIVNEMWMLLNIIYKYVILFNDENVKLVKGNMVKICWVF